MTLNTTAEERAEGRALFEHSWDSANLQDAPEKLIRALDDIDTLLAEVEQHRSRIARIRELLNDLDGQDTDHAALCPVVHGAGYRCRCDLAERKELFKIVRGLP